MDREPIPPQTPRSDVLGQLCRERWFAADSGEAALVAQIDREIRRLSAAGTAVAPTRETAAAPTERRQAAARTKTTPKKGPRRASAR